MPLKIFRQVALEGVKIDKVQKGHEIQPQLLENWPMDFCKKFCGVREYEC